MVPKQSLVWNYFDNESNDFAKCTSCNKEILTKGGNTKGLHKHLRTKHLTENTHGDRKTQII